VDPVPESEHIRRAREGDAEAFAALVRAHEQVAFRAAFLLLRDSAAAEDAAQEAFVRAHRALGRFREGDAFRPWLLRIVSNVALNELRSRKRREGWLGRLMLQPQEAPRTPEALVVASGELRDVDAAMQQLKPGDRNVLYLRHYLELGEREMAEALGCAPGTVKSRMSRASARLRTIIERDFPDLARPRRGETHGGN
jgi:RNA polymerase sigma factor (sigma-70 family)